MKNPAASAPGSGPTLAPLRDATGRAHDNAGRFLHVDQPAPHVLERRARVRDLYPEKTCAEIGAVLGWAAPTIWQDIRALGLTGSRQPGARRKHPEQEERECANPECAERFTPASWELGRRFHSHACGIRATRTERVRETARELRVAWRRRADEEISRLNAAGYLTSRQLAAERKVTESAVSQWITRGLLKAERRVIDGTPPSPRTRRAALQNL
jgi:hypothetical protein